MLAAVICATLCRFRGLRATGQPLEVKTHDFPDKALGKAVPYGVYDIHQNEAGVSVGISHDHRNGSRNPRLGRSKDLSQRPNGQQGQQLADYHIKPHLFHGVWNDEIRPRFNAL